MATPIRPVRRVVTGNDEHGRSRVLFDSAAPCVKVGAFNPDAGMTDVWTWAACPAPISGTRDDGNGPFHFEPPATGGHLRIVDAPAKPADYDPASDLFRTPPVAPHKTAGGTWERGNQSIFTTRTHKSETLDYGILLDGERRLMTDDGERVMKPGDVCIQVGSWHAWQESIGSRTAFVMMGAKLDE